MWSSVDVEMRVGCCCICKQYPDLALVHVWYIDIGDVLEASSRRATLLMPVAVVRQGDRWTPRAGPH